MSDLPKNALYEGAEVDFQFGEVRPGFGDLFEICGYENPNFPPSGKFDFEALSELQFSQTCGLAS